LGTLSETSDRRQFLGNEPLTSFPETMVLCLHLTARALQFDRPLAGETPERWRRAMTDNEKNRTTNPSGNIVEPVPGNQGGDNQGNRDEGNQGQGDHGESRRSTGTGVSGGNSGAGRSGQEGLGSEKPVDGLGSEKPGPGEGRHRALGFFRMPTYLG
jgi:hypothetical protein